MRGDLQNVRLLFYIMLKFIQKYSKSKTTKLVLNFEEMTQDGAFELSFRFETALNKNHQNDLIFDFFNRKFQV